MQHTEQERNSWIKLSVILSFIFLFIILNITGGDVDFAINKDNSNMILMLKLAQAVLVVFLFILPAFLFSIFWTNSKVHYLGITKKPLFGTLIIGSLGMLPALPMINFLAEINQNLHLPVVLSGVENWMRTSEHKATQLTEAFTQGTSVGTLILNLIVIALLAALSEELFFRGMLQKVLIECFKNKHIAIWFGAALFSAFHMQFLGFLPRMVMGAFLGYLFLWSGSLWPSILAHFLNNGAAVFLIWLANREVISKDIDKMGTEANQLVYVVISCIAVIGSLYLVYKIEQKNRAVKML